MRAKSEPASHRQAGRSSTSSPPGKDRARSDQRSVVRCLHSPTHNPAGSQPGLLPRAQRTAPPPRSRPLSLIDLQQPTSPSISPPHTACSAISSPRALDTATSSPVLAQAPAPRGAHRDWTGPQDGRRLDSVSCHGHRPLHSGCYQHHPLSVPDPVHLPPRTWIVLWALPLPLQRFRLVPGHRRPRSDRAHPAREPILIRHAPLLPYISYPRLAPDELSVPLPRPGKDKRSSLLPSPGKGWPSARPIGPELVGGTGVGSTFSAGPSPADTRHTAPLPKGPCVRRRPMALARARFRPRPLCIRIPSLRIVSYRILSALTYHRSPALFAHSPPSANRAPAYS